MQGFHCFLRNRSTFPDDGRSRQEPLGWTRGDERAYGESVGDTFPDGLSFFSNRIGYKTFAAGNFAMRRSVSSICSGRSAPTVMASRRPRFWAKRMHSSFMLEREPSP